MPRLERVVEHRTPQVHEELVLPHRLVRDVQRDRLAHGCGRQVRWDDGAVAQRREQLRPDVDEAVGEVAGALGAPVEVADGRESLHCANTNLGPWPKS